MLKPDIVSHNMKTYHQELSQGTSCPYPQAWRSMDQPSSSAAAGSSSRAFGAMSSFSIPESQDGSF